MLRRLGALDAREAAASAREAALQDTVRKSDLRSELSESGCYRVSVVWRLFVHAHCHHHRHRCHCPCRHRRRHACRHHRPHGPHRRHRYSRCLIDIVIFIAIVAIAIAIVVLSVAVDN